MTGRGAGGITFLGALNTCVFFSFLAFSVLGVFFSSIVFFGGEDNRLVFLLTEAVVSAFISGLTGT